jgi:hypothetical protein
MQCAPSATSHSSSSPAPPFAMRLPPCRSALQRAAAQCAVLRRTAESDAQRGAVRTHTRAHAWGSPCVSGAAQEARAAPVSGVARRPSGARCMRALRSGPQACVVGAVGEAVVRRLRDHVRKVQPLNGAVQCSAAQRSAVQRSGVQPCVELCRARHTACSAALAVTTAARNPSHAMFTRGPAIGTAPFESFRKFPKVLPRCGRERAE